MTQEYREITLPSFVSLMRDELDEFAAYWEAEHEKDPEHFSWIMGAGKWLKQMNVWETGA